LPVAFPSVLFPGSEHTRREEPREPPPCLRDLNLDQVVDAITAGREEYDLKPFFYAPLKDAAAVQYRQQVFRDLENARLLEHIRAFARQMRSVREQLALADKLYYRYEKERWFLDSAAAYCHAVSALGRALDQEELSSTALLAFREYLRQYTRSEPFLTLLAETENLQAELRSVKYCLLIHGDRVTVRHYDSETDYSAEVEQVFAKFQQGKPRELKLSVPDGLHMNHVEAAILNLVARLHPGTFARLDQYRLKHAGYLDDGIAAFDREMQFYLAYLEYIAPLRQAGLPFCYPAIATEDKEVHACAAFDLALAHQRVQEHSTVVGNDFYLTGPERILVVSGPNQGGKTTFARMVGQLHYLAALGCPVPGTQARLFLVDHVFTHFEKEEDIRNLRGKLQDDLVRIHSILAQATSKSLLIMNELFTSTTSHDALFLGRKILEQVSRLGALCVYVTFLDELASLNETTVSMVATVAPHNPAMHTYQIVRRPPDGRAYAIALAEKYGLTYDRLRERLKS